MESTKPVKIVPKTWTAREYYKDYKNKTWWIQQLVDGAHTVFGNLDPIPNSCMLDFGCGPIISGVISASRVYEDIYMSDYADQCLDEIRKWLKNETDSMDYSYECELIARKEAYGVITADCIEHRLRNSIKGVISCDIHQSDPLLGNNCPRAFDAIQAHSAIGVTCTTLEMYKEGIKKLVSLLKPGGMLVIGEDLQQSYWCSGEHKYHSLCLEERDVREAAEEAGLHIREWSRFELPVVDNDTFDGSGSLVFTATKCE